MYETRRLVEKELPDGWRLVKDFDIQDDSQWGYRWGVKNECGRIVIVGKTLDRIRDQLEGLDPNDKTEQWPYVSFKGIDYTDEYI